MNWKDFKNSKFFGCLCLIFGGGAFVTLVGFILWGIYSDVKHRLDLMFDVGYNWFWWAQDRVSSVVVFASFALLVSAVFIYPYQVLRFPDRSTKLSFRYLLRRWWSILLFVLGITIGGVEYHDYAEGFIEYTLVSGDIARTVHWGYHVDVALIIFAIAMMIRAVGKRDKYNRSE
jgi:hypothetical protein